VSAGSGVIVENVYVPAGGDVPDASTNPKFAQKLAFVGRMTRWAETLDRPTLIVGDFNIAPLECDVYDHKALLKVVSHTPIEVETLARFRDAHGWVDLGRAHIPAPERCYSWWSYRSWWRQRIRGGASTTPGPHPNSPPAPEPTAWSRTPAAGTSHRTTCRW
jgi:exodeoxyribonuclease-3